MPQLKLIYEAKIIRYNFGDPFRSTNKIYDSDPTKKQLEDFLKEVNENSEYRGFDTRIHIEKYYQVFL